jgi:hypothetical protein
MYRYKCPHCGRSTISWLRKMCLGPALPATCSSCGGKVGVPYTTMLVGIPLVVCLMSPLWLPAFVVTIVIWTFLVPLEKR